MTSIVAVAFGRLLDYTLPSGNADCMLRVAHKLDAVMAAAMDTGRNRWAWDWTLVDTTFVTPDFHSGYLSTMTALMESALGRIGFLSMKLPQNLMSSSEQTITFCRKLTDVLGQDTIRLVLPKLLLNPSADGVMVATALHPKRWQVAVALAATDLSPTLTVAKPLFKLAKHDTDKVNNPDGSPGKLWLVLPAISSLQCIKREHACPAPTHPHYLDSDSEEFRAQYYRGLLFAAGMYGTGDLYRMMHEWGCYTRFYRISHFVEIDDATFKCTAVRDVWRTAARSPNGVAMLTRPVLMDPDRVKSLFVACKPPYTGKPNADACKL
jgi:hypothetical protein